MVAREAAEHAGADPETIGPDDADQAERESERAQPGHGRRAVRDASEPDSGDRSKPDVDVHDQGSRGGAAQPGQPAREERPQGSAPAGIVTRHGDRVVTPQAQRSDAAAAPAANGSGRQRGRGAVVSSTIVLPELPRVPDLTGPLTAAGEVLVTGTIDLPSSLAETGEHPRNVYRPDGAVDGDDEPPAGFHPVSATRAVGSYAARRSTVTPEVKKESRLVKSLPYIAGGMAVIVIALVVAGFVFHVF
jgi:hypothetical protein